MSKQAQTRPGASWTYKPTAAVTRARFIGHDGNQIAAANVASYAVSADTWDANDITRAATDFSGNYNGLTGYLGGFLELEVGGAVGAVGTELTTDNQGRGVAAASTNYVNAIAYGTAAGAGERITVLKVQPYVKP
jgi:hypothetical protein